MKAYIFVSTSPDGQRNLAYDEYFLDHIAPDEIILYFYINAGAVIIGNGQNPWAECRLNDMEKDGVQLVRRITGGGAVFHDQGNLNFSFIAGESIYDLERQLKMILNAVRALGIPCDFSGRNDLLADGRKFSGNAFCTRGRIRQHHGTLLIRSDLNRLQNYLNVDPRKLQAKGAKSVRSRVCNLCDFVEDLTPQSMLISLKKAFADEYGMYTELTEKDIDPEAVLPYIQKHTSPQWLLGRTPRFDIEIENRFTWGNAQLLLTLREGAVDSIDVYTDSMDAQFSETVRTLLKGVPYGSQPMSRALRGAGVSEINELADYIFKLDL